MPRYTPTENDMYSTKPCFICGCDVLDEGREVCGHWMCEQQYESYKEDLEADYYDLTHFTDLLEENVI